MFSRSTVAAMLALASCDVSATTEEKRAFRHFLSEDADAGGPQTVLTFSEASRRLGSKTPQFSRKLAKMGRLKPVYGTASRPLGVTASSVDSYILSGGAQGCESHTLCASKDAQSQESSSLVKETEGVC